MYVKMYRGFDPVMPEDEIFIAVFNGRAAPCTVTPETERWWSRHRAFAQLKRYLIATGRLQKMEEWSIPANEWPAVRAINTSDLIWEGFI